MGMCLWERRLYTIAWMNALLLNDTRVHSYYIMFGGVYSWLFERREIPQLLLIIAIWMVRLNETNCNMYAQFIQRVKCSWNLSPKFGCVNIMYTLTRSRMEICKNYNHKGNKWIAPIMTYSIYTWKTNFR